MVFCFDHTPAKWFTGRAPFSYILLFGNLFWNLFSSFLSTALLAQWFPGPYPWPCLQAANVKSHTWQKETQHNKRRGKALLDKIFVPKNSKKWEDSGIFSFKFLGHFLFLLLVQKWSCNKTKIRRTPKMGPNKRFSRKSPGILIFWNNFLNTHFFSFWPDPIYWDINFVLECLPAHCELTHTWLL